MFCQISKASYYWERGRPRPHLVWNTRNSQKAFFEAAIVRASRSLRARAAPQYLRVSWNDTAGHLGLSPASVDWKPQAKSFDPGGKDGQKAPSSIMKFAILSFLLVGIDSLRAQTPRLNAASLGWLSQLGRLFQLRETALNAGYNEGTKGRAQRSLPGIGTTVNSAPITTPRRTIVQARDRLVPTLLQAAFGGYGTENP